MPEQVVTFDLFSALIDSRSGGSARFGQLAGSRSWPITGEVLYDRWDRHNKAAHKDAAQQEVPGRGADGWVSYRRLSALAMSRLYAELSLEGDAEADADLLINSMSSWPLWPDVARDLPALDVRGALEAGCPVIRLRRPGHGLDPSGPRPTFEVGAVSELPRLLDQLC